MSQEKRLSSLVDYNFPSLETSLTSLSSCDSETMFKTKFNELDMLFRATIIGAHLQMIQAMKTLKKGKARAAIMKQFVRITKLFRISKIEKHFLSRSLSVEAGAGPKLCFTRKMSYE